MDSQRDFAKGGSRIVPVQREFLFVDAAQAKTSRQGRRNARSFVMQKARRERPWSTSKHAAKQRKGSESTSPRSAGTPDSLHTPITATPSPPLYANRPDYFSARDTQSYASGTGNICSDCHIFVCRPGQALCPKCCLLQPVTPVENPNNNLFDPFGTSSIEMNGNVSALLEHFASEMAPSVIAVDFRHRSTLMRSEWFGTAIKNAGFMHSLLCTAALHLYCFGRGSIDSIHFHRDQAIAAINAALSHPDGNVAISDANIGAVFNLLTVEECLSWPMFERDKLEEDQPHPRAIHTNGLRKMVQLRGGLKAMSSNRVLQAFMLWHSTAYAIATFQAPEPSMRDFISTAEAPCHPPGYQPKFSQHLLDCCRTAGVKDSLTDLVESVLVLIADLNAWFSDPNSVLDPLDIQNYTCILECMLLKWLHENEFVITPLEDALCVALLIFAVRTTQALKQRADIHQLHVEASRRLEQALNCTVRSNWQSCSDLLLWILSIGAISAEGSAESNWFVHQASLACVELGISSAEALLARLELCGWVSFKLNEAVCYLWNRIIDLRLEPYFEPLEDANSPVGPLQHHVAQPYFDEWKHVGWPSFNPNQHVSSGIREQGTGLSHGTSWNDSTVQLNSTSLSGPGENLYDYGHGYYPVFHYNPSKPHNGPPPADVSWVCW